MLWPQGPEDRNSTRFTCMGVQPPHCRGYGVGLQPADEGSVTSCDRTGERGVRRSGGDRCTGGFTAVRTGLPRRRRDRRNTEVTGFSEHRAFLLFSQSQKRSISLRWPYWCDARCFHPAAKCSGAGSRPDCMRRRVVHSAHSGSPVKTTVSQRLGPSPPTASPISSRSASHSPMVRAGASAGTMK